MCTIHKIFQRQNTSFPLLDFTEIILPILKKKHPKLKSVVIPILKHDILYLVKPTLPKPKLFLLVLCSPFFTGLCSAWCKEPPPL